MSVLIHDSAKSRERELWLKLLLPLVRPEGSLKQYHVMFSAEMFLNDNMLANQKHVHMAR